MADEPRTPEEVAREWMSRPPEGAAMLTLYGSVEEMQASLEAQRAIAERSLADLIRRERDDAFAAAFLATTRYAAADVKGVDDHWKRRDAFWAARRLAVEGRSGG